MRHIVIFIVLLAVHEVQARDWVAFEEGVPEGTAPKLEVIKSDLSSTIIEFTLYGIYREQRVAENEEVFDVLDIPDFSSTAAPCLGGPRVPTLAWHIAIPPEGEVEAQMDTSSAITMKLSGYKVYPEQPYHPAPDTGFVYDEHVYSTDFFFPEEMIWFGNIGSVRGLRIMAVEVNPIHFNPATGELLVYRSARMIAVYDGVGSNTVEFDPASLESVLRRKVVNYDFVSSMGYRVVSSAVSRKSWGNIKRLF